MSAAPKEPPPVPATPQASAVPVNQGEAQAKASEYNEKANQAKQDAAKDGKTAPPDDHKPPAPPAPQVKDPPPVNNPGAAPAPAKAKEPAQAKGAQAADKPAMSAKPGPAGPSASASAQASVDADVGAFFDKTPHDKSKEQVNGQVAELVKAAQQLKTDAPPKDGTGMTIAKAIIPGLDSVGAKPGESDAGKIANITSIWNKDKNPYKDITGKHAAWIQRLAPIRDLLQGVSSILGKIGIVLSILGLLISITGIGAPLGAPLTTIGNVITISCLIMDSITMILSGILEGLLIATLKEETDPAKRKALAEKVKQEAANTATALVSVVMAIPGVGKAASLVVGKVGALVNKLMGFLKINVVLKAGLKVVSAIGKKIWAGIKKVLKIGEGSGKGFLGKAANVGSKVIDGYKKFAGKVNSSLEAKLAKAGESKVGKALGGIGNKANSAMEKLEKYSGKKALDKLENSIDYYMAKGTAKADTALGNQVTKLDEKLNGKAAPVQPIDTAAQKAAEDEAAKKVAAADQSLAKAKEHQADFNKNSKYVDDWESAEGKATTKKSTQVANEVDGAEKAQKDALKEKDLAGRGTDAQELDNVKKKGGEFAGRKDAIEKEEKETAEKLKQADEQSVERVKKAKEAEDEAQKKLAAARKKAEDFNKSQKYVDDWDSAEGKAVTKKSTDVANELDDAEKKFSTADKEFHSATDEAASIEKQKAAAEANERAQARMNKARGDKDAFGGKADPKDIPGDGPWKEFKDSFSYKDLGKEGIGGKVGELKEILDAGKEGSIGSQIAAKTKEKITEGIKSPADLAREHAKEVAEKANEGHDQDGHGGGGGGDAPKLSAIADAHDGVKSRVTNLLHDMTPQSKADAEDHHPKPGQGGGGGEGDHAGKPPAAAADHKPDEGGGDHHDAPPAPAGAAPLKAGEHPGDTKAADAPTGAIPFWPALLTQYGADLKDLGQAEEALKKYKVDQVASYNAAVGIETSAKRENEAAKGRKPQVADNVQQSEKDSTALTKNAADNTAVSKQGDKSKNEKDKAKSEGDKGSQAASTPVEDPPKDTSWWGKLKGALSFVKNWILGKLADGMKFIQDAITKCILSVMGIKPEEVKELTDDTAEKGKKGAGDAKDAGAETQKAGAEDDASVTKSGMAMSEAKKLQAETQGNVAAADQLLGAIGQLKTELAKEIDEGKKFIADVTAAYQKEKADGMKQAKDEEAAAHKQQQQQQQQAAGGDHHDNQPKKDEADPHQVARVKQAAQLVLESDTANAQKLGEAFSQGKGLIGQGKNPEAVSQAQGVFASGDAVAKFKEGAARRSTALQGILGKNHVTTAELTDEVGKVEDAAAESDDAYHEAVSSVEADFQACYAHANKPAPKAPAQASA